MEVSGSTEIDKGKENIKIALARIKDKNRK